MTPIAIGFAGRIGAGKSSASSALAATLGWPRASFGSLVRTIAAERGLDVSRETLQAIGEGLEAADPIGFCRAVLSSVDWQPGTPVVIDGIRHVRILQILKDLILPIPFFFVYLEAPAELRRSRVVSRGDFNSSRIGEVEAHSTERDVVGVLQKMADLTITSDLGSAEVLVAHLRDHLERRFSR